jgi:hypothetical protein
VKALKLAALSALAILALAACGGSPAATAGASAAATSASAASAAPASAATSDGGAAASPPPSAAAVDTCALLTQADLKTVTSLDYGPGTPDTVGQCIWTDQGRDAGIVVVYVQDVALDFIKTSFAGGTDVTVAGHAGYWNPGEGLRSLWVDVGGGRTLVLSFPKAASLGAADQANAIKLAEIAIGKLPG